MMKEKYGTGEVKKILDIPHATLFKYINACNMNIKKNEKGNLEFTPADIANIKLVMTGRDSGDGFNTLTKRLGNHDSFVTNHDDVVIEDIEYIEEDYIESESSTALIERLDNIENFMSAVMTSLKEQSIKAYKEGNLEAERESLIEKVALIESHHKEKLSIMIESHQKDLSALSKEIHRRDMEIQREREEKEKEATDKIKLKAEFENYKNMKWWKKIF